MKLRSLVIDNFRGIQHLRLDLADTTVLIGENNTGKTAILDALRLCLDDLRPRGRTIFEPFDFHLANADADPASALPIRIQLRFAEATPGEWPSQTTARLQRAKVLQVRMPEGTAEVTFQVKGGFDPTREDFTQTWAFLASDGSELEVKEAGLDAFRAEVSFFYLAALRDAARHFDAKGKFWRPFLKESQLAPEKKAELEKKLQEVNELVITAHQSFDGALKAISRVAEVLLMAATDDLVSIDVVPARLFDILSKSQVSMSSAGGAKVPLGRHGEGTQSLAVLLLFSAFLSTWSKRAPFIAIEEPEAHLHPAAVRALWKLIDSLPGQKLITTHSGDLIAEAPINAVRRLVRCGGTVKAHALSSGTLSPDERRKIDFHIRFGRGELLFARCWILCEGETELTLLPGLARHLGIDLERRGVRCVQYQHVGLEVYLKFANDFGISWCVLSDSDLQGKRDKEKVDAYRGTRPLKVVLHPMPEPDIEQYLCTVGFGTVYESMLSTRLKSTVQASPGDEEYWAQVVKAVFKQRGCSKPLVALQVLQLCQSTAVPVPPVLEAVLRGAVKMAEA